MEQIKHNFIPVKCGIKLHVAEIGTGSYVVFFVHGFPEIWYSWRHQMIALANAGYRAIAPDYRGYGLSDPPPLSEDTTFADFTNDMFDILDSLNISKVFVIGKDFGGIVAYDMALQHPDRVLGIVTLGVTYVPLGSQTASQAASGEGLPEGFYISRWREPGRAEAEFGRFDAKTVVRNIYILFSKSDMPVAAPNQEIMDLVEPSAPLPPWFTEEDLQVYGDLYQNSGFRTALQVPYRMLHERPPPAKDSKIEAPALLIMGGKDYVFKFPGIENYIRSGAVKRFVPNLEITYLTEGSHFAQEQFPEQVNRLILAFLRTNEHTSIKLELFFPLKLA